MKKTLIIFLLQLGFAAAVFAQSNEVLDDFLAAESADLGTSAYLVLAGAGKIDIDADPEDALEWIEQSGILGKLTNLDSARPVTYGEFSYILMEVLDLEGGLMYRLLPGPRYAAREAAYRRWILGKSAPGRILKPFEVMNALTTVLDAGGAS